MPDTGYPQHWPAALVWNSTPKHGMQKALAVDSCTQILHNFNKKFTCRQPQSKIAADILPTGKAAKSALMRKLMKKKPAGAGRAAKVSVEGRGIML